MEVSAQDASEKWELLTQIPYVLQWQLKEAYWKLGSCIRRAERSLCSLLSMQSHLHSFVTYFTNTAADSY